MSFRRKWILAQIPSNLAAQVEDNISDYKFFVCISSRLLNNFKKECFKHWAVSEIHVYMCLVRLKGGLFGATIWPSRGCPHSAAPCVVWVCSGAGGRCVGVKVVWTHRMEDGFPSRTPATRERKEKSFQFKRKVWHKFVCPVCFSTHVSFQEHKTVEIGG